MSKNRQRGFYDFAIAVTIILGIITAMFILWMFIAVAVKYHDLPEFKNITLYDNSGKIIEQWTGDLFISYNNGTTQIKTPDGIIEISGGIIIAK